MLFTNASIIRVEESKKNIGIHDTNKPHSIGGEVSHGCV
ncbi:L,D-transpeptidase [Clostridium sp. AWRP]|nr:L,D-transpeptidase [Clostridium sp. AWRP]